MRFWWLSISVVLPLLAVDSPREASHRREFVIGLSPYLDRSVKDEVYRGMVRLLVQDLPLNSSVAIYDAFQLQSIAEMTLPDSRAFTSPKMRANQFSGAVQALKTFLAKNFPRPTNAALNFDSALRLPQFCDFLIENGPGTNSPLQVLLVGSPLYQDAKEPAFSMMDGYFPSDGHLLASREQSVYGLRSQTGGRGPMQVHWVYFGDPWLNELHREKITRFWSLFLERRAGRLVTFCADLPTALKAFGQATAAGVPTSKGWALDPAQTKVEMLRISRNVDLTDWITRDSLTETPMHPPSVMVGPLKIGIRWRSNVDLDLYAAPRRGADTLYFEHPRSREGYYYKDHRSSPGREYEFVEFQFPVDVRQVQASVNFYQGFCPGGPRGEVRIEFDGRIYSAPFTIPASQGNQGRSGQRQEEFWTRIPVQEILRLAPAASQPSLESKNGE